MDKVIFKRCFSFLCVIFIFNSFFFSSMVYASSLPSLPSSSDELDPDNLFWDLLKNSLDRQIDIIDGNEFLLMPSEDFNSALQRLANINFPFGATPHLQNNLGSIPITLPSSPVAYIPFFYKTSQSSDGITLNPSAIAVSSDHCGIVQATPTGFSSANLRTSFSSYSSYAITGSDSQIRFCGFESDSHSSLNSGAQVITQINVQSFRFFGVFECSLDDPSVFDPPTSALPSGGDVYIPKGSTSFADTFYKVGDDFYDIEGNPISDPFTSNGGNTSDNTSGSHGGDVTVGGKIDVDGKVDVNVNINGNGNIYDMPDTGFFESYLDDALEESSGIRKFIGDFFGSLPGQITQLICLSIVIAILCRIIGR